MCIDDTIWLDIEHQMAVRARNVDVATHRIEIRNQRFKELVDELWIPKVSQMRVRRLSDADKESTALLFRVNCPAIRSRQERT